METMNIQLSARNVLVGKITEIRAGLVTASVKIDLGNGQTISSVISKESIDELGLKVGEEAYAIIKSTEVIVGK
jgi:molybdopterin-binding protein